MSSAFFDEKAGLAAPGPESSSDRRSTAFGHTAFGLKPKHSYGNQAGFADPRDYENKYPEDPIYEELSENARVWRVYLDEAADFDADMIEKASDGLDLLLVFAGLFSAVLTTFVAQTSQSLSNNYSGVSASLLSELVLMQRAIAEGAPVSSVPPSDTTSGPSHGDVWVNGLWFISLTLSLSTALLAVLVRQWLHQYTAITSGTSRNRSLIRQYRYDGLIKWHVPLIISLLPVFLHVALGLFLCPYRTPFSDILHAIIRSIQPTFLVLASALSSLQSSFLKCTRRLKYSQQHPLHQVTSEFEMFQAYAPSAQPREHEPWQSLKEMERAAATTEDIGARAIMWLLRSTSNPPTTSIALQSLGGFSSKFTKKLPGLVDPGTRNLFETAISNSVPGSSSSIQRLERLLRSRHAVTSIQPPMRNPPPSCYFSPETPFTAKACLLLLRGKTYHAKSMQTKGWNLRDLFLAIVDGDRGDFLLPRALWDRLQDIDFNEFQPFTSPWMEMPPDLLQKLYRFAFKQRVHQRGLRNRPFQVQLSQVPQNLVRRLAISTALQSRHYNALRTGISPSDLDMYGLLNASYARCPITDGEIPEALLIISSAIWDSPPSVGSNSVYQHQDKLDSVAGVWSAIECSEADIGRPLAESLSTHAIAILKDAIPLRDDNCDRFEIVRSVSAAIHKLGGDLASLTYAELFQDEGSVIQDESQTFPSLHYDYLWVNALSVNTVEAFTYLMNQDTISKLSPGDLRHQWRIHHKFFLSIIPAFIKGLSRHSLPRDLDERCRAYLFQPERLFVVCAGFDTAFWMYHDRGPIYVTPPYDNEEVRKNILALVSLDPDHPSWADRGSYSRKFMDASISSDSLNAPYVLHPPVLYTFHFLDEYFEARKSTQSHTGQRMAQPVAQTLGICKVLMKLWRQRTTAEDSPAGENKSEENMA
ncbi:hypothetical protein HGRIS_014613 [Hohenbuehelia grisea]|uniref:DUF6535 domain-containing protein n=1 Tax=Hohenbuehelia grisea TaxID=104357 RepID=A0ABR3JTZ9_9AGAR